MLQGPKGLPSDERETSRECTEGADFTGLTKLPTIYGNAGRTLTFFQLLTEKTKKDLL